MAFEDKSLEMAKRLKQLRVDRGFSHEKLAAELSKQYGIRISKDSLINYEVADPNSERKYPNNGMKIEYLRCLADFFGVSTDYLLGLTDPTVTSPNMDERAICNRTGLSSVAVHNLLIAHDFELDSIITTINMLLCHEDAGLFLFGESQKITGENVFRSIAEFLYSPNLAGHFLISADGQLTECADRFTSESGSIYIPHGYVGSVPKNEAIERFQTNRIIDSLKQIRKVMHEEQGV